VQEHCNTQRGVPEVQVSDMTYIRTSLLESKEFILVWNDMRMSPFKFASNLKITPQEKNLKSSAHASFNFLLTSLKAVTHQVNIK